MALDYEAMESDDGGLRHSLYRASRKDPAREAEVISLAGSQGLPVGTVDRNLDEVRSKAKLSGLDVESLERDFPKTANYMRQPDNAAVSIDDLDVFKKIEENSRSVSFPTRVADIFRAFGAGPLQASGLALQGAGGLIEAGGRTLQRATEALVGEDATRAIADVDVPVPLPGEVLGHVGKNIGVTATQVAPPEDRQNIGTDISSGVGQLAGQIMTAIAAPQLIIPMGFAQGAGQQVQRQEQSGTLGSSLESDQALVAGAMVTSLTEKLGVDFIMRRLPGEAKDFFQKRLVDIAMSAGGEAAQEVVEGVAQGVIELATTNPNAKIFEGLDREAIAAGGAAGLVRSAIHLVTRGKSRYVADEADNLVSSLQDGMRLDEAITLSQTLRTRELSPEKFNEFVDSAYGDQVVYISQEAAESAIADGYELPAPDGVTGDISISMREFLSNPELAERLKQDARLDPLRMTRREIEADAGGTIENLVKKAMANAEVKTESDRIYEQVSQQLIDTGRIRPQDAKLSAQIIPAYISVKAQQYGVSPEQLYADMGLKIEGPKSTQKRPEPVLSRDQDFGGLEFEDTKIIEETGQPVVIKQPAQRVWDQNRKRRDMTEKLLECVRG